MIDQGLATEEVILVGAAAGTSWSSLTRGFDGSSGQAHSNGATVKHVLVAADLEDANAHRWASPAVAADQDIATTSIHHTLGAGANQAAAGNHATTHASTTGQTATDHHAAPVAGPDADITIDAAGGAGTAGAFARSAHGHKLATSATAAVAIGTAAAGTSGHAPSRDDHVHPTGAGTPSTQAIGDAAVTGSGAAAMTNHKHAMPAFGGVTANTTSSTSADGSSVSIAHNDHDHGWPSDSPRGTVGYAEVTANSGTFSVATLLVQVSVTTVTGRRYKVTVKDSMSSTVTTDFVQSQIKESGTTTLNTLNGPHNTGHCFSATFVEDAGASRTYDLYGVRSGGTGNITNNASVTSPTYVLVEDIGT